MNTYILEGSLLLGGAIDRGGNLEEPISRGAVNRFSARTFHEAKRKKYMARAQAEKFDFILPAYIHLAYSRCITRVLCIVPY